MDSKRLERLRELEKKFCHWDGAKYNPVQWQSSGPTDADDYIADSAGDPTKPQLVKTCQDEHRATVDGHETYYDNLFVSDYGYYEIVRLFPADKDMAEFICLMQNLLPELLRRVSSGGTND